MVKRLNLVSLTLHIAPPIHRVIYPPKVSSVVRRGNGNGCPEEGLPYQPLLSRPGRVNLSPKTNDLFNTVPRLQGALVHLSVVLSQPLLCGLRHPHGAAQRNPPNDHLSLTHGPAAL